PPEAAEPAAEIEPASEDPDAVREQVRLAVEMARAELDREIEAFEQEKPTPHLDWPAEPAVYPTGMSGQVTNGSEPVRESFDVSTAGIPTLVIENSGGRIDMGRVYDF